MSQDIIGRSRRLSEFFTGELGQRAGFEEAWAGSFWKGTAELAAAADPLIGGLGYDSQKIKPGDLFFAVGGLNTDGHGFIDSAIDKGAGVIVHQNPLAHYRQGVVYIRVRDSRFAMSALADSFYGSPSRRMTMIGVTGTEGKSTTVYLIAQFLRFFGKKAGFISTVQHGNGIEDRWNPEHQTTPEAVTLHALLAEMERNGAEYAGVEASSHGLSPRTNRLGDVWFDAGIMTNVNHEHLEFHRTWEQYRNDKIRLFSALGKGEKNLPRGVPAFGVVNADDPSAPDFARAVGNGRCLSFSVKGADADLSVQSLEAHSRGNRCRVLVRAGGESLDMEDHLPGAFNAGNILAALITVSTLLDVEIRDCLPLAGRLKPVRGRMTAVNQGQPFEVLVDYAHTPASFQIIFPPLRERLNKSGGRLISLFGSPGERDTPKRPLQGGIAGTYSDMVILCDEDPRGEVPMSILEDIARGIDSKTLDRDLFLIPHRPQAIRKAFSLAKPGDLVLLLGKGHENSIIYAGKAIAYDEFHEAETALAELGWGSNE
jgi:UDP-N-acetylmuramoyl-L-alanyl-D-glutamate--2,6-diaminopimelate ligase